MNKFKEKLKFKDYSPVNIWKTLHFFMPEQGEESFYYIKEDLEKENMVWDGHFIINIDLLEGNYSYSYISNFITPLIEFISNKTNTILITSCREKKLWALYYGIAYKGLSKEIVERGLIENNFEILLEDYNKNINKYARFFISREFDHNDNIKYIPVGTIEPLLKELFNQINAYGVIDALGIHKKTNERIENIVKNLEVLIDRRQLLEIKPESISVNSSLKYCSVETGLKNCEVRNEK